FIPSELRWKNRGLVVRQQTRFPEEAATHLSMTLAQPARLALRVRQPAWAHGASVRVNGRDWPGQRDGQDRDARAASYLQIDRDGRNGDASAGSLPMALHTEAMPDNPNMVAVMYGPMMLVGDLGKEGLDGVKRYGPSAPQVGRVKTPPIPAFVGDV